MLLAYRTSVPLIAIALLSLVTACSDSSGHDIVAPTPNLRQDLRPVPGAQEDINGRVHDRVYFPVDSATLDTVAQDELAIWINLLRKYPNASMVIEGHADERGTRDYNFALGERRAEVVKRYLLANGLEASRLRTLSYGKERPAVLGSSEAAWAQNRRVVGIIQ